MATSAKPLQGLQPAPQPVEVANEAPISVEVHEDPAVAIDNRNAAKADATDRRDADRAEAAGYRNAEVLSSEGQRRVNFLWERTQASIAVVMVVATIAVAAFKSIFDALSDPERGVAAGPAFLFLVGASNLVIGFYFGRTNHTRTGGVPGPRRGE